MALQLAVTCHKETFYLHIIDAVAYNKLEIIFFKVVDVKGKRTLDCGRNRPVKERATLMANTNKLMKRQMRAH